MAHSRRLELRPRWEQMLAVCVSLTSIGIHLPNSRAAMGLSGVHTDAMNSPFHAVSRAIWSIYRSVSSAVDSAAQ